MTPLVPDTCPVCCGAVDGWSAEAAEMSTDSAGRRHVTAYDVTVQPCEHRYRIPNPDSSRDVIT